jgi:hypothetical protein
VQIATVVADKASSTKPRRREPPTRGFSKPQFRLKVELARRGQR